VSKISSKRGVTAIVLVLLRKMCVFWQCEILKLLNSQCRREGRDFRFKEDEDVILNLNLQAVVKIP
jgi:hypothetical protein